MITDITDKKMIDLFTKSGIAGGTLTAIIANITMQSISETIALSAVGAVISFFVSYYLKRWLKKRK
jgi:hypothetical protein